MFSTNYSHRRHFGIDSTCVLLLFGRPIPGQKHANNMQKDRHRSDFLHTLKYRRVHIRAGYLGVRAP